MTVAELIEELKKLPPDFPVYIPLYRGVSAPLEVININRKVYEGDVERISFYTGLEDNAE